MSPRPASGAGIKQTNYGFASETILSGLVAAGLPSPSVLPNNRLVPEFFEIAALSMVIGAPTAPGVVSMRLPLWIGPLSPV